MCFTIQKVSQLEINFKNKFNKKVVHFTLQFISKNYNA